jgi:DNA-binding CsgD family transcriptional regulator/PAS domain-containing protein
MMIERVSALIHTIYEGCTDPAAWPRITGKIADQLEAEKGILLTPLTAGADGFAFPHGIAPSNMELWATRYQPDDMWVRRLVDRGLANEGSVVLGNELVTDEELRDSVWYREFLSRMNIFRLITGTVFGAGDPDIPVTSASLFRSIDAPPFDEHHRALLKLLVPHMSRSLGVMFKLRDAEFRVAASLHALERIRHGILLLNESGRVIFVNDAADRILQRGDGLRLVRDSAAPPKLTADCPTARAALEQALRINVDSPAADTRHFAQAILARRTTGGASYALQISYLPESNPYRAGSATPHAVVFIKDDLLASRPDPTLLQQSYGLTQAEARAALALCDGGNLDAVATQLNIKVNTLKTHLKSIYVKTSLDSRAALTRLLLSLAIS